MKDARRSTAFVLTPGQRTFLAGFLGNFSIVLFGFSLTDQPLVSHAMTPALRGGIMVAGLVVVWAGLHLEGRRRRNG